MENKTINIGVVAEVAEALKGLREDMVFVGGAVISLYADDPAADEIRPTQDVDVTMAILNLHHWQELQEKLRGLGFHPDPFGHATCRYIYKDIAVDIMAAEDGLFGPSNRWYKIGFEDIRVAKVKDQEINILSAPCYLSTKFEAFNSRGKDCRTSHDMEDIIYVIDNRISIVEEVNTTDERIHSFLKNELLKIVNNGLLTEVLIAHLHPLMAAERIQIVEEKISLMLWG